MSLSSQTYELIELCELADVTPRTVRYYVQQGLLPSPGTRGPGARYDERHLGRLRLIRRLQRQHLPLAEIRRQLAALDDDAVRVLLRESRESRESREEPNERSALAYVRDVLGGTSGIRGAPASAGAPGAAAPGAAAPGAAAPGAAGPPRPAPLSVPNAMLQQRDSHRVAAWHDVNAATHIADQAPAAGDARERPDDRSVRIAAGGARSTWERIELAPDLELHVRRPLSRAQNKLVDRLIQHARTLFSEEP